MLPGRNWQGSFILYNFAQVNWQISCIYSSWGGNVSLKIHLNLLDSVCFGFPLFSPLCNRETHHYLVKILVSYFWTIQHLYLWPCTSLRPLVSIIKLYEPVLNGFLKVGMQVTFGSPVVVLFVAVDVSKCTRSWLWAWLCARRLTATFMAISCHPHH